MTTAEWEKIRTDFPILATQARGKSLVYLDNAATTQKPRAVIDRISRYYLTENANIHRGVHYLSEKATQIYEKTRVEVAKFIGASHEREIIFTRGTTEAINLIAFGMTSRLSAGDEILISGMEHHSNIVPWQIAAQRSGATLRVLPINERGELCMEQLPALLTSRTKIVAITQLSNALGTINPVREITRAARAVGAWVLVDGAQAVSHIPVNVRDIDCDFYAFSSHKIFGPTGVGVLWGRESILKTLPPYQSGGDMIRSVSFEKTDYADLPAYFEAGTPDISGVIGLGEALRYVQTIGLSAIARRESELLVYATEKLRAIAGLRVIGEAREKASVISFALGDIHPHDVGTIVDQSGVAIRTGHHCAQPVMTFFKVPATARCSLAFYNNEADIDRLVEALHNVKRMFA